MSVRRTFVLASFLLTACGGAEAAPAETDEDGLAGCDRATVTRWLQDSDLDAWGLGDNASGLYVDLPDTQPELSAQMKQQVLDRCGGEVSVIIGPPTQPA